ncbi:hypothetical protein GDO81_006336 [Engystomops pustulosus]|uniref:Sushi domain-containing protein n=1 Tax=Engystomops pustulosus TaxID=76066 RepID=A0AAV7CX65_ENGPU|nr:hypothetical protein GDO81_006336 [Engystomops pustulosus]
MSQENHMGYCWIILLVPAFFASSHAFCGAPPRLDFAQLDLQFDKDNFSIGENVTYSCRPGFIRDRTQTNVLICLSNSTWSTPATFCNRLSCGNPGDTAHGSVSFENTLFGSRANYTCDLGYNMLSKRNYRECQASGDWSNDIPQCEVQKCPTPNAIADGKYNPDLDEYEYLQAVSYQCNNKTLALIGEKTVFCTAYGNWSSDPPECKEVLCVPPYVENSEKVSGLSPPYILNSAVTFQCLQGFTMTGSPSVVCNVSSQWNPPLPTCNRENNVGAIVGGVITGIIGILFAVLAIFYVCWYKKRRGGGYVGPTRKNHESGRSSSHQSPIEQCDMQQIEAQETC